MSDDNDFTFVLLIVVGIIVGAAFFLGFASAIGKTFKSTTPVINNVAAKKAQREQEKKIEDIRIQQRQLMESQQQRLRDFRSR